MTNPKNTSKLHTKRKHKRRYCTKYTHKKKKDLIDIFHPVHWKAVTTRSKDKQNVPRRRVYSSSHQHAVSPREVHFLEDPAQTWCQPTVWGIPLTVLDVMTPFSSTVTVSVPCSTTLQCQCQNWKHTYGSVTYLHFSPQVHLYCTLGMTSV